MSTLAISLALAALLCNIDDPCECQGPVIREVPEITNAFDRIANEWLSGGLCETEVKSRISVLRESQRSIGNNTDELLMRQFLIVHFRRVHAFTNEESYLKMVAIICCLQPSSRVLVEATLPYLCSEDIDKAMLARFLMSISYRWTSFGKPRWQDSPVDLEPHTQIIADAIRDSQPVPVGLVRNMFELYPWQTMAMTSRVFPELSEVRTELGWDKSEDLCEGGGPPEDIENPSSVLMQELDKLATSEKWWVRLWVAEFLNRVPEARSAETWKNLQEDPCELVRKTTEIHDISANKAR